MSVCQLGELAPVGLYIPAPQRRRRQVRTPFITSTRIAVRIGFLSQYVNACGRS